MATAVAGLGMMLRGSKHRGGLNYENLKEFGETVLADRPSPKDDEKNSSPEKRTEKLLENAKQAQIDERQKQKQEVMEMINRASDLFQRARR